MLQRRHLLPVLAVPGFRPPRALAQGADGTDHPVPGPGHGPMTLRDCVLVCVRTHAMCLETARYCTEQTTTHIAPQDCAEMCQVTANSLLRRSPRHGVVCSACAELCETCARDCDAIAGDEQMRRCAEFCRDCAENCRGMAKLAI